MSNLEKFIQNNRGDFDEGRPSEDVWKKLEQKFSKKQTRSISLKFYRWTVAAAVLLIAIISIYFISTRKYSHEERIALTDKTITEEFKSIAPEYAPEFNQIYQSVMSRQQELKNQGLTQPDLYQQFQNDLALLDSSYRMLKAQVVQSPNQDVIIKAMIQNLQLQAELLGRQLMIFKEYNNTKKLSHETSI